MIKHVSSAVQHHKGFSAPEYNGKKREKVHAMQEKKNNHSTVHFLTCCPNWVGYTRAPCVPNNTNADASSSKGACFQDACFHDACCQDACFQQVLDFEVPVGVIVFGFPMLLQSHHWQQQFHWQSPCMLEVPRPRQ